MVRASHAIDCDTEPHNSLLKTMQESLSAMETSLHRQEAPSNSKSHSILHSGANRQHTSKLYAKMQRKTGTLTTTAIRQRALTTHTGCNTISQKNKTLKRRRYRPRVSRRTCFLYTTSQRIATSFTLGKSTCTKTHATNVRSKYRNILQRPRTHHKARQDHRSTKVPTSKYKTK